jgi:hypothetical protein
MMSTAGKSLSWGFSSGRKLFRVSDKACMLNEILDSLVSRL